MGAAIGDVLPLAVGVAIGPIPIIATIVMLMSARAKVTGVGFLLGWLTGIVVAVLNPKNLVLLAGAGLTIGQAAARPRRLADRQGDRPALADPARPDRQRRPTVR